jgi:predicted transcriptional regulator
MINPYEMVSRSALPALRAMVARRLQENYQLTQQAVAKRLGVTQASISNYSRRARGSMLNFETDATVSKAADMIAALLAAKEPNQREAIRTLMCTLHQDLDPGYDISDCVGCDGVLTGKEFERLKVAVGQ